MSSQRPQSRMSGREVFAQLLADAPDFIDVTDLAKSWNCVDLNKNLTYISFDVGCAKSMVSPTTCHQKHGGNSSSRVDM